MEKLCFTLSIAVVGIKWSMAEEGVIRDYCESDVFHAYCPSGKMVVMEEARYGRMKLGSCLELDLGYMNCSSDVVRILDTMCSGRQSCEVGVHTFLGPEINPCPKELRSYLQARYVCVPVLYPDEFCCQMPREAIDVGVNSGYITSSPSEDGRCGRIECPLQVKVPEGMRLNISLFDFQHLPNSRANASVTQAQFNACITYATISEKSASAIGFVCSSENRFAQVYTSISNTIEINIVQRTQGNREPPNFLFKYEAFGCQNPEPPLYGFIDRNGDFAKIGCYDSIETSWVIECLNGEWKGFFDNCSKVTEAAVPEVGGIRFRSSVLEIEPGIVIALIVIIALIISATIIVVGVAIIKRNQHKRRPVYGMQLADLMQRSNTNEGDTKKYSSHASSTVTSHHTLLRKHDIPWQITRPLPNPRQCGGVSFRNNANIISSVDQEGEDFAPKEVKYYTLDPGIHSTKYRDTESD